MAHGIGYDPRDRRAERRTQIVIAVIAALSGIAAAGIGLIGTLRATDSQIVTGPATAGPTVTETVTVAPTATVTETISGDGGGTGGSSDSEPGSGQPSASKTALDVTWESHAGPYNDDIGLTVRYDCPSGGIPQVIYGDGLYTYDSSVCTAGVHDGRITLKGGGKVVIRIREEAPNFRASKRNGITSREWDSRYDSYEFLPRR
jgi:hypothetical protein